MTTENNSHLLPDEKLAPRLSAAESRLLEEIADVGPIEVKGLATSPGIARKFAGTLRDKGLITVTRDGEEVSEGPVLAGDWVDVAAPDATEAEEPTPPADKPPAEEEPQEPEEPRRITRQLPCKLTDAEVIARGDEIDQLLTEAEELEDEKKSAASEFKSQLDKIAEQVRKAKNQRMSRQVEREVEVTVTQDAVHAEEVTIRIDTGEVVSKRTLTRDELTRLRQLAIPEVEDAGEEEAQA